MYLVSHTHLVKHSLQARWPLNEPVSYSRQREDKSFVRSFIHLLVFSKPLSGAFRIRVVCLPSPSLRLIAFPPIPADASLFCRGSTVWKEIQQEK